MKLILTVQAVLLVLQLASAAVIPRKDEAEPLVDSELDKRGRIHPPDAIPFNPNTLENNGSFTLPEPWFPLLPPPYFHGIDCKLILPIEKYITDVGAPVLQAITAAGDEGKKNFNLTHPALCPIPAGPGEVQELCYEGASIMVYNPAGHVINPPCGHIAIAARKIIEACDYVAEGRQVCRIHRECSPRVPPPPVCDPVGTQDWECTRRYQIKGSIVIKPKDDPSLTEGYMVSITTCPRP